MKLPLISFFLFTFLLFPAISQNNDAMARLRYKEAKAAYDKQNYSETVRLLDRTNELLGKPNIRTQSLLVRALSKVPAWQYVPSEVKKYLSLNPDTSLVDYDEIMGIASLADYYIQIENDTYKALEKNPTTKGCNDYLENYPYGKYRDDVNWLIAKTTRTYEGYYVYIDKYPKGKHIKEAKTIVDDFDTAAYNKAITKGTQEELNSYLNNYPRSSYANRADVKDRLTKRVEYDIYVEALNGKFETYIDKYPNGKYSSEINKKIEEKYYTLGNSNLALKEYDNAQIYYNKYISKFPQGSYIAEVKKNLNKCVRISNRQGAALLAFSYDTEKAIAISFMALKMDKINGFVQVRIVPEHLDAEDDVDSNGKTALSDNVILTSEERNTLFSLSMGLTYKIAYPVWIIAGGNVGFYHVQVKDTKGTWYNNTDKAYTAFSPHLGLSCLLAKKVSIQYMQIYHKGIVHQIGIGVNLAM